jgi:hypothetical protein
MAQAPTRAAVVMLPAANAGLRRFEMAATRSTDPNAAINKKASIDSQM